MTTATLRETPVGELVVAKPARARIFEQHRIDYCCGGKRTLADAAAAVGADLQAVETALAQLDAAGMCSLDPRLELESASGVIEHLLATHHAYLHTELPRLSALVQKVATVHADTHPELAEVLQTYQALRADLEPHMQKEEMILFPLIQRMDQGGSASFHCGSVAAPISVMEYEHDVVGQLLRKMRELTHDYAVPVEACNSYRAMLDGLETLERDTFQHVHKENNILFPKAMALAEGAPGGGGGSCSL